MCGIIGYVGRGDAPRAILEGLRRLEYRGYDSAGVAAQNGHAIEVVKRSGRLEALETALVERPISGHIGIGHTRWATHGAPTDANAHPHIDCAGKISVVHNGIIENHQELRRGLIARGHTFRSETDSEVLAHLIEEAYQIDRDPAGAVRAALRQVRGSYAVCVLFEERKELLVAARKDSPLIVGLGEGENIVASDVPALVHATRQVLILDDGEVAEVTAESVRVTTLDGTVVEKAPLHVGWNPEEAEKGGFAHFMLKEIYEQPQAVKNAMAGRIAQGRVDLSDAGWSKERIRSYRRVYLVACGTAYHAGLVGRRLIEEATDLLVAAELASEFRYAAPRLGPDALVIAISQSGETADTLAALKEAKRQGADVLAITNVVGSSVAREATYVVYTQAGPEIAVASTKAYLTQLVCLALVAVYLGEVRGTLDPGVARALVEGMTALPEQVDRVIKAFDAKTKAVAARWKQAKDVFYLGRGLDYAVAMEGQLKLKEISYIHAEALAAGELKHGTLALIEEGVPVVALATQNHLFEKTLSNLKEVGARGGRILALALEGCPDRESLEEAADEVWYLPTTHSQLAPVLAAVPLQLLAYYSATVRGCDVDKPRNLAKSVTVE